jgi:hypothetical protein
MVMSISVDLSKLAEVMGRYRFAYLLSASSRGAPHELAVIAVLQGGELVVNESGRRTWDNAQQRPDVALVWPRQSDYFDGQAVAAGAGLRISARVRRPAPVRAVPRTCCSGRVRFRLRRNCSQR